MNCHTDFILLILSTKVTRLESVRLDSSSQITISGDKNFFYGEHIVKFKV